LQDLKLELDFRHVAGYVTGDDGEGPPVDVPAVMKRLDTIKRMCKSDVPSDLVRTHSSLRIICEALRLVAASTHFIIFFCSSFSLSSVSFELTYSSSSPISFSLIFSSVSRAAPSWSSTSCCVST
jgi:hypothetical protein